MSQSLTVFNPADTFSADTISNLEKPLASAHIKERVGPGGSKLKYIKASTAIETANRVFGHGRWGYKIIARTLEQSCNLDGTITGLFYTCDLELSVAGAAFTFPGDGVGIVTIPKNGGSATPESYEKARKEATSDALKRALRNYGDQFGLPLYDEDSYVENANGDLVQVKELNKHNAPVKPRVVVDAQAPSNEQSDALKQLIAKAKARAKAVGVATNIKEWYAFVAEVLGSEVQELSLADVGKINGSLTQLEKLQAA